eukprot:CAMPEP_0117691276 /NCGR_PEP_ID=MMETSP0804-20121206/25620_1 /TAXON_ID=1074897 /ORGANISM="Tetraselmis astigmatica, Strain CCMP880" /LENGTH=65 /DNA_ID=CAMNT_0005504471 /DNA_START=60 /DNA_END=253 /DNA_ORIENTATION=-
MVSESPRPVEHSFKNLTHQQSLKEDDGEDWIQRGNRAFEEGSYDAAIGCYLRATGIRCAATGLRA